jgi:hypothetical protein
MVLFAGCAEQDSEPAPETAPAAEAAVDEQPVASEDFETGEPKGVVHEGEDETDTEPAPEDEGEDN